MFRKVTPLLLLSVLVAASGNTLKSTINVGKLEGILKENLKSTNLSSFYYALKGLTQLNAKIPNVCEKFKTLTYDAQNVEHIFHFTNAAALASCQGSLTPDLKKVPLAIMEKDKDATIQELYHAVYALKAMGQGAVYEKEAGLKNLIQLLKKDDSPANYAAVFGLCEHMGCTAWTRTHAESALLAADEADSRSLSFDGGLPVTAAILSALHRAHIGQSKPSPLTEAQRLKFAEFLVSRREVSTARGAALLLEAAFAIADDPPTPIAIAIKGRKYISGDSDTIEISVTDVLGRRLPNLTPKDVIAQSATRLADDVVVLSKQPLTLKEGNTFELNLAKLKTQHGVYKIALSAGKSTANVEVAVLGEARAGPVEVGLGDVDGTTSPKVLTVTHPERLPSKLQADHMQKLSLKFTVSDAAGRPSSLQQVFLRVAGADQETVFVAEHDAAKAYRVDATVKSIGKLLNYASGDYSLTLLLGDSAVAAPLAWHLGDIAFNFGQQSLTLPPPPARGPLPAITHKFRPAEPRPPRLVSDVFAAACAAPLLLLLVLWLRLGVNLSNYVVSISALLFHTGLGASLGLYGLLWLQLTMFETFRYLLPLALVTFLAGHRLLRHIAARKALKD